MLDIDASPVEQPVQRRDGAGPVLVDLQVMRFRDHSNDNNKKKKKNKKNSNNNNNNNNNMTRHQ